jgi:hypothetical protein
MGERLTVVVDDGITDMLVKLAGGNRQQGKYISKLVRAAWTSRELGADGGDYDGLLLQVMSLAGQVKILDGRVTLLERLVRRQQGEQRGEMEGENQKAGG